ncbi:EscU/YscU/HrcU family type III secretion system export apparatus switch protein [Teichococcus vastitatis]|uniref:EscU/YscU/HrcU family type III secretion system export apparatus switch protein n=1 Tax=Teichococcus vastitatis TaxID=2307076 RepID=UPI000E756823|nr:flagellar type III secretion system protein FlhB [Pseudoroseomonas vastitatis]
MSEESGQEKTLDASPRKLQQAREKGDIPISREGSSFGLYAAMLLSMGLAGGVIAQHMANILLPLVEQPDAFLELSDEGYRRAGAAVMEALAVALLPVFGLLIAGSLLPHLAQNSIVVATERLQPKFSNLSPLSGFKRLFGLKALFEFCKSLAKASAVGVVCWIVGRPLYQQSGQLAALDPAVLPGLIKQLLITVLFAVTLVAGLVAAIDIGFQRFEYRRRQRMSLQEMREEMKSTEGDPHVKAAQRKKRRQMSQRRMMADVPKATVVIANPTHFAVALRYERGEDAAPVCLAKGVDNLALRIREAAQTAGVAVIEDRPLARALYATVEVGDVIPPEHFEAVAKVIGIVWAQSGRNAKGASQKKR